MVTAIRDIIERYWGVVVSFLAINIFFSLTSEYYLTFYNVLNIMNRSALSLTLAVGMVFVLATGGIDLSVGSVLAFTGIVMALLFQAGVPTVFAILVGILLGSGLGATNGLIISRFRLQPFIVTLATLSIARGLALVFSGGNPIVGMPNAFMVVFAGPGLLGNSFYIAVGIALLAGAILGLSRYGVYVQALGDSQEATYLCGVNTRLVRISVYAISGLLASVASLMFMARMDAAEPIAGLTTEWMEAIAAPIIGGNTLDGGRALIFGAVIGVLILSSIRSGLNMMGIGQHFQQIAIGTAIIAAVIIDSLRRRKHAKGA